MEEKVVEEEEEEEVVVEEEGEEEEEEELLILVSALRWCCSGPTGSYPTRSMLLWFPASRSSNTSTDCCRNIAK